MREEQDRIKKLLTETIVMLCKSGLRYKEELEIKAVLGITIDKKEVFIVHVDEIETSSGSVKPETPHVSSCTASSPDTQPSSKKIKIEDHNSYKGYGQSSSKVNVSINPPMLQHPVIQKMQDRPIYQNQEDESIVKEVLQSSKKRPGSEMDNFSTNNQQHQSEANSGALVLFNPRATAEGGHNRGMSRGNSFPYARGGPNSTVMFRGGPRLLGARSGMTTQKARSFGPMSTGQDISHRLMAMQNLRTPSKQNVRQMGSNLGNNSLTLPVNHNAGNQMMSPNHSNFNYANTPIAGQTMSNNYNPNSQPSQNAQTRGRGSRGGPGSRGGASRPRGQRGSRGASNFSIGGQMNQGSSSMVSSQSVDGYSYDKQTVTNYICNICNTTCKTQSSLLTHQVKVHGRQKKSGIGRKPKRNLFDEGFEENETNASNAIDAYNTNSFAESNVTSGKWDNCQNDIFEEEEDEYGDNYADADYMP